MTWSCKLQPCDVVRHFHGLAFDSSRIFNRPIWEVDWSNPQSKHAIAAKPSVLCCHLANTNEELGGLDRAIPPFAKLLWSLFAITTVYRPSCPSYITSCVVNVQYNVCSFNFCFVALCDGTVQPLWRINPMSVSDRKHHEPPSREPDRQTRPSTHHTLHAISQRRRRRPVSITHVRRKNNMQIGLARCRPVSEQIDANITHVDMIFMKLICVSGQERCTLAEQSDCYTCIL